MRICDFLDLCIDPDFAPLLSTTWKERRTFGKGQRMKSRRNSPS